MQENITIVINDAGTKEVVANVNSAADAMDRAAKAQDNLTQANRAAVNSYNTTAAAAVKQAQEVEALTDAVNSQIKNIDQWRDVEGKLVDAQQRGMVSTRQYAQLIKQLDSQLPNLTASIKREQDALATLEARYDPLSAKMKKLESDEKTLTDLRNKGIISMQQYQKVMAGISGQKAVVSDGIDKTTKSLGLLADASSGAKREFGVLIGELARGNFAALEGSSITLANRLGILEKLFSTTGLAITGVIGVLAALAVAAYKGAEEQQKLNAALIVTNNTSGQTADSVNALAQSLQNTNGQTAVTRDLLQTLIATGRTTSGTLTDVGQAAVNAMRLTGDSVDQVSKSFERLYDDPVKWADEMDKQFHFLTLDVRDHAQELEKMGDKYGAAEVIAKAFADNTNGAVKQLTENMGYLDRAIQSVSNHLANVREFWFSIGKDTTPMEQFVKLRSEYTEYMQMAQNNGWDFNSPKYQQAFQHAKDLYAQMLSARQKVIDQSQNAKDLEQMDQQRQAVLEAAKGVDSINDKTQKQITLQTKLNKLAQDYKTLYLLDPNDKRLQGVSFDVAGNPSGGAYASKVQELNQEANGKPKTPKIDNSATKELEQYYKALENLQNQIDPTLAAMRKLSDAQDLLNRAVAQGDMTQTEANKAFEQYKRQLQDTIDPVAALTRKLNEQITSLEDTGKKTSAQTQTEKARQDLLKQGITLTDEQAQSIEGLYTQIDKLTAKEQIYQRIQKSVIDQTKGYADTLKVLGDMQSKGQITKGQADQYLVKEFPTVFQNTQKQLEVQLAQYQQYYAMIDEMRKNDLISEQDAATAKQNIDNAVMNVRLGQAQNFLSSLMVLENTHSKKAFAIGKAAAIANAVIDTYKSATGAYAAMSSIPYVGPFLGAAAAAAAIAAGIANVSAIRAQQMQGYRNGGEFLVGGSGGTDSSRVSFMATPGERVTINTPAQARALERMGEQAGAPRDTIINQSLTMVVAGRPDRQTRDQLLRDQRRSMAKEFSKSNSLGDRR